MKSRYPLAVAYTLLVASAAANAQDYRNVNNTRFNTVSDGPLQALVVDVANSSDRSAVNSAVAARVNAVRRSRESALMREIDFLRQKGILKGTFAPGIPDIVMLRERGRLAVPVLKRTRAGGDITFVLPLTSAAGDGGWTLERQQKLQSIIAAVYPELKNVYGDPSWTGTVTIRDGDNMSPIISDRPALTGGIFNVSTNEIIFAEFTADITKAMNLTEMMCLAFRGPASISYDAWEIGQARAATMVTVQRLLPVLRLSMDEYLQALAALWHTIEWYDLLNQPPLGNDRFFPVSLTNTPVDTGTLAGMLVPRLEMAGSAWLKVMTENPTFLHDFNGVYYQALTTNPNLKNSIPALKSLAAGIVPTVEGLAFGEWYQRQFVLDTSVSIGEKLYAFAVPSPPAAADDDFAIGVFLVYYRTIIDTSGNSNELNLSGTSYPVYWDYSFTNRLFLNAQYERVDVRDGFGKVSPTFFNTIGGDPQLNGKMRIAMDFPLNSQNVRLYVAPRSMGKSDAPNNLWGVVVGADTGTMQISTETGVTQSLDVKQGAFGGAIDPAAFSRPNRATLKFTNTQGNFTTRQVNVGYNELIPIYFAADPVTSITHTLPAGPAMISFPIRPLQQKAADALLDPGTGLPLFNDNNLLLAQWRQNILGDDKYLRYPSLDPIQPGLGYWSKFDSVTTVMIKGKSTIQEVDYSVGLLHGWNQIGTPYETTISIGDLQFQYLADNVPQNLQGAIDKGWILAQTIPLVGNVVVWDFNPFQGYVPANVLEPWKGYFIRILVSEGLTITYPNPTSRAAVLGRSAPNSKRSTLNAISGWSVPITVRTSDGLGGTAYIGQSDQATTGFDPRMDAQRPPDFTRAAPTPVFSHPKWGDNAGEYFSDIHRTGARDPWVLTVNTPDPTKTYTLSWGNLSAVPRTTRLILVDMSTGRRQYMNTSSGYTFTPGAASRKFQILPENRTRGGLLISNLNTRQTRAASTTGVQISYDLSVGADIVTEIRNATGQVIRHLGIGRAATPGANQVVWDARDDRSASVPSGTYIVKITARTPEGETTHAVAPVLVLR